MRVKSGNNWFNTDIQSDVASALNGQTFGVLNIPFTRFTGANFNEVQAIELYAARVPGGTGLHIGIDLISTVPEPSALAMVGMALGIGLWRRCAG